MAEEKTFKAFNSKQAQAYLARGAYHDRLYELILRAHESTGGAFGKFIDVGCGPGNSTRELAKHFDRTWGSDPSEGMIEMARQLSEDVESETKSGGKIVWEVGREEDVGAGGREGEVDMIAAAMAVCEGLLASSLQVLLRGRLLTSHNLDGAGALVRHEQVLDCSSKSAEEDWDRRYLVPTQPILPALPDPSTPNASAVNAILDQVQKERMAAYEEEGGRRWRMGYADLPLPWDLSPPAPGFSKHDDSFSRIEKNLDGQLGSEEEFFLGERRVTLKELGGIMGTASSVVRWREVHPELAGTKDDIIINAMNEVREVLGREDLVVATGLVLLIFKKN